MNALQSIPAHIRTTLYWIGYVLGVVGQGITIVWGAVAAASPDVSMPLWLVITSAVIGLAQTQLNLLAGSNVTDPRTVSVQAPQNAETTLTAEVTVQDYPHHQMTVPTQVPSKRPDPAGPVADPDYGDPHRP